MSAVGALIVILAVMVLELQVAVRNERHLRRLGAIRVPDPVYPAMRLAYPGAFIVMTIEGAMREPVPPVAVLGVAVLLAAKALKFWAIRSLDGRWSYRVFVLPDAPLVSSGPYRWLRHPNYVAVIGELIGFALTVSAPVSGLASVLVFGQLLRRRIRSEEEALQIR